MEQQTSTTDTKKEIPAIQVIQLPSSKESAVTADKIENLKSDAILDVKMEGLIVLHQMDRIDKEHRRLTGTKFFKTNDGEVLYWMICFYILAFMFYFFTKKFKGVIEYKNGIIDDLTQANNNFFSENISLREKIEKLTSKVG